MAGLFGILIGSVLVMGVIFASHFITTLNDERPIAILTLIYLLIGIGLGYWLG